LNYAIIDEDVTICENAVIGSNKEEASKLSGKTSGITVLGRGITVSKNAKVDAGEIVDKNV
jgi:serine acetyltransferase